MPDDDEYFHFQWMLEADGKTPRRVRYVDIPEWAAWWADDSKRVVRQELVGPVKVSTVFLAIDHNFFHEGPPLLWETMTVSE